MTSTIACGSVRLIAGAARVSNEQPTPGLILTNQSVYCQSPVSSMSDIEEDGEATFEICDIRAEKTSSKIGKELLIEWADYPMHE